MGLPRFLFACLLGAALLAGPAAAAAPPSGVEGLASLRGALTPGVVVLAFTAAGPGPADRPAAVSAPTGKEGKFLLGLPPGQYHLLAMRTASNVWTGRFAPGDLFAYHLGNPVAVEAGRRARVAFNLVVVPAEPAPAPGAAGVAGRILFGDEPLPRSYLYVYRDAASGFRGPGESAVPAGDDGRFRLRLAPGRYFLIARKRRGGGMYGPPGKDDYVGYYPGNPVEVRPDTQLAVTLETTTRVDELGKLLTPDAAQGWFSGRVVDAKGAPAAGLYVLFYPAGREGSATPAKVAGPTGADGAFRTPGDGARYRIVARTALGGPPAPGELYGAWHGPRGEGETVASSGRRVTIRVEPYVAKQP